ncbi:uncharacterized protein [Littorina saxatilis]|uniref:Uncharacterized protein n=1 Tax=Littorina saxatilis TaxID=31220 RepID=A0AAN9C009_9CAEN
MAGPVTLLLKVSLPVLLLGIILLIVTLVSPHWFSAGSLNDNSYAGLWKACGSVKGNTVCVSYDGSPSWIAGPEALECMALSCGLAAFGLAFKMLFRNTKITSILATLLAALSGILGICGAGYFYHKETNDPLFSDTAWCFYVNIVSDVIMLAGSVVLLVHTVRMPRGDYTAVN